MNSTAMDDRDFWTPRVVAAAAAAAGVPLDFPRSPIFSRRQRSVPLSLAGAEYQRLDTLAEGSSFLTYVIVVAAVKICLHRFSGSRAVVVGSPRYRPDGGDDAAQRNAIPILDEIVGDERFDDLLVRGSQMLDEAYAHQNYPFDTMVAALESVPSERCPLFDVMVWMHGVHEPPPDLHHDLTIELVRREDRLDGDIHYNAKLFHGETIERFARRLERVVCGGGADRNATIGALAALPEAEQALLAAWNETSAPLPDWTAAEALRAQARRTPDAIALTEAGTHVTYRELLRRATRIARGLRAHGARRDTLVALCLKRSAAAVAHVVAVLLAEAAYLPLDPGHPLDRISALLADAGALVAVTEPELVPQLAAGHARIVEAAALVTAEGPPGTRDRALPDNLAYLLYTSGSTGAPKAVAMTNGPLSNLLAWQAALSGEARARTLQYARLDFDVSFQEIFSTLCFGGTLVMAADDIRSDPDALFQLLRDEAVTRAFLPVVALNMLADAGQNRGDRLTLREVLTAGEQLQISPAIVTLFRSLPRSVLHNQYGPTEAHVVTSHTLVPPSSQWPSLPPLGAPIANTAIRILDPAWRPVPIGGAGMICIGGVPLARGYWRSPGLTALKYVPDPYASCAGARMYVTGDLGRYAHTGTIEFLGRADRQCKILGHRIEPGEIETTLRACPDVRDAVVRAWDEPGRHRRLVAYVVGRSAAATPDTCRTFLARRLQPAMVPSQFVMLEALPLTSSGKVDWGKLPSPAEAAASVSGPPQPTPANPQEAVLARIWAETLGIAAVGPRDNFFALGGDSILAIQVVTKAREHGLQLVPRDVFRHQTVAALVAAAGASVPAVVRDQSAKGPAPLTPIQHWFFDQPSPNPHHFNMSYLFALAERVAAATLARAVSEIVGHHEALRTQFRHDGGAWTQVAKPSGGNRLFTVVDCAACTDAELPARILAEGSALHRSLDFAAGDVFRAALFDLGPLRGQRLLMLAHHLVIDSVSWRILLRDLQTLCRQIAAGEPVALPPPSTPFTYWAQRLNEHARSATLTEQVPYWRDVLSVPAAPLPIDEPTGTNREGDRQVLTVLLEERETERLLHQAMRRGAATVNELLLTALARAFRSWGGSPELAVDIEGHGRDEFEADLDLTRTVGWFTTIVPLRLTLSAAGTLDGDFNAVRGQIARLPNHGLGYGLLRYLHRDPAAREELSRGARAAVSFNYLGQFEHLAVEAPLFVPAPERTGPLADPGGERPHELYINGFVRDHRLLMRFNYSGARFRRRSIETLADTFLDELRGVIAWCVDGRQPAAVDFPLAGLTDAELADVLASVRFDLEAS